MPKNQQAQLQPDHPIQTITIAVMVAAMTSTSIHNYQFDFLLLLRTT